MSKIINVKRPPFPRKRGAFAMLTLISGVDQIFEEAGFGIHDEGQVEGVGVIDVRKGDVLSTIKIFDNIEVVRHAEGIHDFLDSSAAAGCR